MKKKLLLLLLIIYIQSSAQILFEKGYFVDDQGQKKECWILNKDWKNNPSKFIYKLNENGPEKTGTLNTVKEFGVYNAFKFEKATVQMDLSSEGLKNLSNKRAVDLVERKLFLRVLIEGNASLFFYENNDFKKFFYKKEGSDINQLIFKSYLVDNNILKNEQYKQQLFNELSCENITEADVERLDYKIRSLKKFFIKYNECSNNEFSVFEKDNNSFIFHLTAKIGVNIANFRVNDPTPVYDEVNYGTQYSPRIGLELEAVLPFNKNKWSLIIEPTFRNSESERIIESNSRGLPSLESKFVYTAIQFPFGFRHYSYISKNSKLFFNALVVLDYNFDSKVFFGNRELEIFSDLGFSIGIGYTLLEKVNLEVRHTPGRDILLSFTDWESRYSNTSIILGYTLF